MGTKFVPIFTDLFEWADFLLGLTIQKQVWSFDYAFRFSDYVLSLHISPGLIQVGLLHTLTYT
jgi:hypothetical protein